MYYYLRGDTMTKLCPRGKAAAKRKFKVYPSAYANAYASKICAGKIKDPSGKKRKDWGPKRKTKKAKLGGEMKLKVKKAGLGAIALADRAGLIKGKGAALPVFGLAGMAKYMEMNRKKNRVEAPKQVNQASSNVSNIEAENKKSMQNKYGAKEGKMISTFQGMDVAGGTIKGENGINESMVNYYKDLGIG